MKKLLLLVLILTPALVFGQLGEDGKTETKTTSPKAVSGTNSTLLYSGATLAPFGIKYSYARDHGFFLTARTSFEAMTFPHTMFMGGYVKPMENGHDFFIGAGLDVGGMIYKHDVEYYKYTGPAAEIGLVFHLGALALELGAGFSYYTYSVGSWDDSEADEGDELMPYLSLGLGFSF